MIGTLSRRVAPSIPLTSITPVVWFAEVHVNPAYR
jgi:hypothetical protein